MKRVVITTSLIFIFILLGTIAATFYAQGYRLIPLNGKAQFQGTGLLVLNSHPDGASVLINGHFTTATNNTINLFPGDYDVRIEKDGYFPWHKKITVRKEIVSEADVTLFPLAPRLDAITYTGASDPIVDPTGSLIAYTVASSSAQKNGIYILNLNAKPIFSLGSLTTQLVDDTGVDVFSNSQLSFSPDSQSLLATVSGHLGTTTYLLHPGSNQTPQDVTATLPTLEQDFTKQQADRDRKKIEALPRNLRLFAAANFSDISFSVDENRIVYTASESASLPIIRNPRLVAVNSTPEDRNLKQGNVYVYDIKEDRNYKLFDKNSLKKDERMPVFLWNADSSHLFFVRDQKINVIDFDGINLTTLYAGPFVDHFVYPWPDGSSLVILTNLNIPDAPTNLYRITLK